MIKHVCDRCGTDIVLGVTDVGRGRLTTDAVPTMTMTGKGLNDEFAIYEEIELCQRCFDDVLTHVGFLRNRTR